MADGSVNIDVKLEDSKAKSQASKTGKEIGKGIESGMKSASTAAKNTESQIKSAMSGAASSSKSSFSDVGSAAKSGFGNVSDAAKTASSDASSSFKNIPADAAGSFSDVGSKAKDGFEQVSDSAKTASEESSDAFDRVGESIEEMARDAVPHGATIEKVLGTQIPMSAALAVAAVAAISAALVKVASDAVEVGMEFDKSMSQVAATMGITTDEIGELTEFAKQMGAATAFSATQASEALNYMALAGYSAQTSMEMLPTVLNLAAAGSMELATASDMVTDAQSALGLTLDETSEMVDKMAMASSKSNTSVEQLGNAFLTVGGTAKNLKGGTTELATALGILADNGIKGSEGGTALRNMILSLSAPVDKAADELDRLGISVFDAQGNMRSLNDIFGDFNDAFASFTAEEKTKSLNTIFNKVDLKSVNAMLANTTTNLDGMASALEKTGFDIEGFGMDAKGMASQISMYLSKADGDIQKTVDLFMGDFKISAEDATMLVNAAAEAAGGAGNRFDQLTGYINNAAGAAQKMADTQLDNLAGDVTLLESATEGLQIQISDLLTPALRAITQFATNSVMPALSAIVSQFGKIVLGITSFVAAYAGLKAYKAVMNMMATETKATALTVKVLGKEINLTALSSKAAAIGTKALTAALKGLRAAAPMLAFTALVEVLFMVADAMDKAREHEERFEKATTGLNEALDVNDDKVKETADSLNKLNTTKAQKSFTDLRKKIDENIEAQAKLAEEISESWTEVEANSVLVAEYTNVISALTNKIDENGNKVALDADEQKTLTAAVAGLNEITGQSIEVIDSQNGILSVSTEEIKKNSDEWVKNARAQAAQEMMVQLAKQQIENEMALKSAQDERLAAEQRLREAEAAGIYNTDEQVNALERAKKAEQEAQELVDANAESQMNLAEVISGTNGEILKSASSFKSYIESRSDWSNALKSMSVDVDKFAAKLSELGFSTSDLANVSVEGLEKLAASYNGTAEEIIAICDELGIEVPEKLKQVAEDGGEATAEGIQNTTPKVEDAAENAAQAEQNGYASGDSYGTGSSEVSDLADGIESGSGEVEDAAETDADAAETGFKSNDDEADTWGSHLVQNFASGISAAISWVTDAARSVANAAASILGFSVPKEGIWSGAEKGGERSGLHLVENFARGMLSGKSQIKEAADEIAETVEESLAPDSSAWDDIIDTGEEIARGLVLGYDRVDPAGQIVASMGAMMAMSAGSTTNTTTNNTTWNINQPIATPDELFRAQRMRELYGGLAGRYGR